MIVSVPYVVRKNVDLDMTCIVEDVLRHGPLSSANPSEDELMDIVDEFASSLDYYISRNLNLNVEMEYVDYDIKYAVDEFGRVLFDRFNTPYKDNFSFAEELGYIK